MCVCYVTECWHCQWLIIKHTLHTRDRCRTHKRPDEIALIFLQEHLQPIKPCRKINITLCLKSMISVRHHSEKVTDGRITTIFSSLFWKTSNSGASGSSERERLCSLTVIQLNDFLHLKRVKVTGRESRQLLGSLALLIRILMVSGPEKDSGGVHLE